MLKGVSINTQAFHEGIQADNPGQCLDVFEKLRTLNFFKSEFQKGHFLGFYLPNDTDRKTRLSVTPIS